MRLKVDLLTSEQTVECSRCGQEIEFKTVLKRRLRNFPKPDWCVDCTAKPQRKFGACLAWDGDFDIERMVCLLDGVPFLVGVRSCGRADCVNRAHILGISE